MALEDAMTDEQIISFLLGTIGGWLTYIVVLKIREYVEERRTQSEHAKNLQEMLDLIRLLREQRKK